MSFARLYRVGTPYNGVDLADLSFEQSANVMYMAHLNYPLSKITRASHTSWTFTSVTLGSLLAVPASVAVTASTPNTDSPNAGIAYFPIVHNYVVTAINDTTGDESLASSVVAATNDLGLKRNYNTITWAAVTNANRYRVYKGKANGELGYIGSTTTLTFQDDNIGPNYADGPPLGYNPFAAVGDYPSTVTFYQQRLVLARTNNRPNGVWASKSGQFENFNISRPLRGNDSIAFALVAGRVNAVNAMASLTSLIALTSDATFSITGGGSGTVLTPTQVATNRQNGRGSSRLHPLIIDNVAFFQTSVGNSIRSVGYEFQSDGFNSSDVTLFSQHLFVNYGIKSWCYSQSPRSLIWAVRSDGKLLCFTWEQEQEVWGWTLCETDGLVDSICNISELGEDRVYMTVKRMIGGVQRTFIERMASTQWSDITQSCYLDCAVSQFLDTATNVVRGLGHLEGRTVDALADGAVVSGLTVTNGMVTLPDAAKNVSVGLPYSSVIETLPLALNTSQGWTLAKPSSTSRVVVRLLNSRGVMVGPTEDKLTRITPRHNEPYGQAPAMLNGYYEKIIAPDVAADGVRVVVKASDPLPMTVAAIYLDPAFGD